MMSNDWTHNLWSYPKQDYIFLGAAPNIISSVEKQRHNALSFVIRRKKTANNMLGFCIVMAPHLEF